MDHTPVMELQKMEHTDRMVMANPELLEPFRLLDLSLCRLEAGIVHL